MTASDVTASIPPTVSVHGTAPAAVRSPELARGTPVGRYIVLDRIGQGGMGTVYKAYDPDLDRNVALKLVRADSRNPDHRQRLRARLQREAQTLARLAHPNVVAVHDIGGHDDSVFVAMELVDGTTLTDVLADQAPPVARIVELFVAAARGLAAAHDVAIIHRDFKPDNVIVGRDGRVRVLDFGLARALRVELGEPDASAALADGSLDGTATATGALVGTPAYMAPEQRTGSELDARTDQFSFCVALHEALFRRRPGPGNDLAAMPGKTPGGQRVPARLRAALVRGLAPDPAARHPSMHALIGELTARPRKLWLAGAGAAAIAAIAVLALAAGGADPADPAARCAGGAARLAGVWDAPRRAAVSQALARHGDASTAVRRLDDYAAGWLAMHTQSCRATHVLGEQSAELLDLRTRCLDGRLAEVRYLTELLSDADRETASRAVTGVHALAPLDECANPIALRDPIPPRDPALGAMLRDRLARVRAQFHVGKYGEVDHDAATLATTAAGAGDRWVEASAIYLTARAAQQRGEIPRAEDALYRAIAIAETGRATDVVSEAWMTLAWIAAEDRDRYVEALRLAGVAGGVLARLGGNPRLEATLEDHLGVLHLGRHELGPARHHLERGLALREKLYGRASDDYARSLSHLAMLEQSAGNLDNGLALGRQARVILEAELGAQHPDVLAMVSSEGAALFKLQRFAEAAELLAAGLPRAEATAGPSSKLAASFLTNLGLARGYLKQYAAARAALERSHAIHVAHSGADSLDAGMIDLNLAFVLLDTGEPASARVHAERAVAIFRSVLGAGHPDLAMASEALAMAELRSGRPERAVPALEQAVAIRATAAGTPLNDLAATRFELAKAIVAAGGSLARARQVAEQARDEIQRFGDADGVREVTDWIRRQRP